MDWHTAALCVGEGLATVGPDGYYGFTAQQWLDWALKAGRPSPEAQKDDA
jgi:hypothetical protein